MFTDGTLLFCVTRIRKTQLGEVKEIKKKEKKQKTVYSNDQLQ